MIIKNEDGTYSLQLENEYNVSQEEWNDMVNDFNNIGIENIDVVEGETVYFKGNKEISQENYEEILDNDIYYSNGDFHNYYESTENNLTTVEETSYYSGDDNYYNNSTKYYKIENLSTIKFSVDYSKFNSISNEDMLALLGDIPISKENIDNINTKLLENGMSAIGDVSSIKGLFDGIKKNIETGKWTPTQIGGIINSLTALLGDDILKVLDMDGYFNANSSDLVASVDQLSKTAKGSAAIAGLIIFVGGATGVLEVAGIVALIIGAVGTVAGLVDLVIKDATGIDVVKEGKNSFSVKYEFASGYTWTSGNIQLDYTDIEKTLNQVLEYINISYVNMRWEVEHLLDIRKRKIKNAQKCVHAYYLTHNSSEDERHALSLTYNINYISYSWLGNLGILSDSSSESITYKELYLYPILQLDEGTGSLNGFIYKTSICMEENLVYYTGIKDYYCGSPIVKNEENFELTSSEITHLQNICSNAAESLKKGYYSYWLEVNEGEMETNVMNFSNEAKVKIRGSDFFDNKIEKSFFDESFLTYIHLKLTEALEVHTHLVELCKDGSTTIEDVELDVVSAFEKTILIQE